PSTVHRFSSLPPPPVSTPFPYTTLFRSRRIDHSQVAPGRLLVHRGRNAVSREDHDAAFRHLGDRLHEDRAAGLEICHHVAVVHEDRKSTRLNSSHGSISYAVFCLKKNRG